MRYFMLSVAAAMMLGLGAAQAAQPSVKGRQPGAEAHRTPAVHQILADADGAGADVQSNPNVQGHAVRHS